MIVFLTVGLTVGILGQVSIIVEERDGIARSSEPVTLGVPFAKGKLLTTTPVRIVNPSGNTMDAQFKTMALWDDGSIKWLKCDFQADAPAGSPTTYTLKTDVSSSPSTGLSVKETAASITVTTGPLRFVVNKTAFNIFDEVRLDLDGNGQYSADEEIISAGQSPGPVVTAGGKDYRSSTHSPENIEIEEQGPMKVVIKISGRHYNGSAYLLKYETRIYAYAGKPYIKLWHVYANGKSVETLSYPLDPANGASFDRCGLDFRLNLSGTKTARFWGENNSVVPVTLGTGQRATLLQKDRTGTVEALYYSISRGSTILSSGSRAPGWGTISDSKWGMTVLSRYFWQKYPKGLVFKDNGTVSFEPAPTPEYLWVGMGTGDEILLYFHSVDAVTGAGLLAEVLNSSPLFPRAAAQQYADSLAFYPLWPGQPPYKKMAGYIDEVTDNHFLYRDQQGLYGNINFGDTPVDYWQVDRSELDATPWGNNYYDCNVLTPIRLFVQEGDLRYSDIFIPGVRHFMETACWNTFDTADWMNGYCPAYSLYHRSTAHFQHHYGEGIWYYYYLTGDERAREVGLRAADSIMNRQWWGNENVDCRMAYQRASACLEAWKNTRDSRYLDHARHLLVDKILATQDKYGLIGASYEGGVVYGEQVFMMALYSDTLWKFIQELSPGSVERQELSGKLAKLADFIDTYARKSAGVEEYWNFFPAPSNTTPPEPERDPQNPDATVYWWGKGLIAGTYAYAYHLTGQEKYKTLAAKLLNHLWTAGNIDWGGSEYWSKPSGQVMKNVIHAAAIVNETSVPGLTVTSPNGGESWVVGSTHTVTWTSSGSTGSVDIELSVDNGSTWSTVASATANDGTYSWIVPNFVSAACLIRIGDTNGSAFDVSDAVFSIVSSSSSTIGLSRTTMSFAGIVSGTTTRSQEFVITDSSGVLSWTAAAGASWLTCAPVSGTGSQAVTVTVDAAGLAVGSFTGMITVAAPGAANSPQTVTVNLTVKRASQDQVPFGVFATPLEGARVAGSIAVTGWVLDDVEVESVKIYNGQAYTGDALFVEGARPDVEQAYPGYPLNYRAGWGYMLLTNFLPNQGNGTYMLKAIARDTSGHEVSLGSRTIICDNANTVKPFGAIDTPAQGGTASGGSYVNWGWVLTPQPNQIPTDGSTINVWVDGVNIGYPTYNKYREDIAGLFPGYANSNGAAGYFYLDTAAYENGVHTIHWTAVDDAGNTDGIGSRYFTIQNRGGSAGRRAQGAGHKIPAVKVHGSWFNNEVSRIPIDHSEPVRILKGCNKSSTPQPVYPGKDGIINIEIEELERLEISNVYFAYMVVGGQLRSLPIGSTFNSQDGIFYWQPGPGFIGKYDFVFIGKKETGEVGRINVSIRIIPGATAWF